MGHFAEMRIYLAGPDVFLPEPRARGAVLKAICARHGLTGVFPMDALDREPDEWAGLAEPYRIALRNEAHIRAADGLIANLTPFRGPSADVGTVFELGFMRALNRPVFGWSNGSADFTGRTRAFLGGAGSVAPDGVWRDQQAMALESFGFVDNLMIDGAIAASGGVMEIADLPESEHWNDLTAFERCVRRAAARLAGANG